MCFSLLGEDEIYLQSVYPGITMIQHFCFNYIFLKCHILSILYMYNLRTVLPMELCYLIHFIFKTFVGSDSAFF